MPQPQVERLIGALQASASGDATSLYAVLDGARNDSIHPAIVASGCPFECLYAGELEPDLAQAAPYLVKLERGRAFGEHLVRNGWDDSWGVFMRASVPFKALRRHLRSLLMVYDPDIRPLYFRYYDPRVLRSFLPTCDHAQLAMMFGPVQCYLFEGEEPGALLRCTLADGGLQLQAIRLALFASNDTPAGMAR